MADSSNTTLSDIYYPSVGLWQEQPYLFLCNLRMQATRPFKSWNVQNVQMLLFIVLNALSETLLVHMHGAT